MTDMENGILGEAIRRYRLGAGLTQEQFADVIGVRPDYVSGLERGKNRPSLGLIQKIGTIEVPDEYRRRLADAVLATPTEDFAAEKSNSAAE